MALQTGWVRVKPSNPNVAIQVVAVSADGEWSLADTQPNPQGNPGRSTYWRYDPDNYTDTLIIVVNRWETEDSEIVVQTVWHDKSGPNLKIQTDEVYYPAMLTISAKASLAA